MSQFYVSLEDELMRRFGGDKMKSMMDRLGLPEDQPIQNAIISKTIENAQNKIEGYNFDIRKHVLDYDDVMNKQREVVYKKRKEILEKENLKNEIMNDIAEEVERLVSFHTAGDEIDWNTDDLFTEVNNIFPLTEDNKKQFEIIKEDKAKNDLEKRGAFHDYLLDLAKTAYGQKEKEIGEEGMRQVEKIITLQTIDTLWMNHLDEIDYLREGIGLRGYGQRDPLVEYKREAFNLFSHLMDNVRSTTVHTIFRVQAAPPSQKQAEQKNLQFKGADSDMEQFAGIEGGKPARNASHSDAGGQKPIINENKVGRNDPCPCGSGKKYKKCHGK